MNAVIEYAFNAFIPSCIHVTSPLVTSLTAPLTIPVSRVADRILYGIPLATATAGGWGWLGAACIVVGVYYMELQQSSSSSLLPDDNDNAAACLE